MSISNLNTKTFSITSTFISSSINTTNKFKRSTTITISLTTRSLSITESSILNCGFSTFGSTTISIAHTIRTTNRVNWIGSTVTFTRSIISNFCIRTSIKLALIDISNSIKSTKRFDIFI